jgi:hypothetical protein
MPSHASPDLKLYIDIPTPVFKALVNLASATYPLLTLPYDGVTLGAFGNIEPDMTLTIGTTEGGDQLGRVRVHNFAASTEIPLGRVSQGVEDGTLNALDNMFVTVWDEWRIWSKLPYIDPAGNSFKDANIPVLSYTTSPPPKANIGPGTAGTIDATTGYLRVTLPAAGVNQSEAIADGATIVSYLWNIEDGILVTGTLTSAVITVDFPAGKRHVGLTVTDSLTHVQTSRCPVLAIDPDADVTQQAWQVEGSQRLTVDGQTISFRLHGDAPRTVYPDGALVILWDGEPSSPTDRSHLRFLGWHQSDSVAIRATRTGLIRDTILHCVDVAGRMAALPGFPQALERVSPATTWEHMPNLTMRKALNYLITWHTTAISLADVFLPASLEDWPAMRLDSAGASLWEQLSSRAKSLGPDHILTCNRLGQLNVVADWMLEDVGDRPTTAPILTEDLWSELRVDYHRPPRVHVLRASAVVSSTDWLVIGGEDTLPLAFSIAPGDTFGQGVSEATEAEGLTLSQAALNVTTGHRHARLNARYGLFGIVKPDTDIWALEPALLPRVQLNISAETAAQRGLDSTQLVGLVKELSVSYPTGKEGTALVATLSFERETSGQPAQTVTPELPGPPTDYEVPPPPTPFVPPLPGDESVYYGDIGAYILWDGTHVFRTWDLLESSPTWEFVDSGISGSIYDGQYMHVDADTVGMWLMTSTAIWFCADIMATTPSWSEVLPIATVRAADAVVSGTAASGLVHFKTMFHYWSAPGHLCVATGPLAADGNNIQYEHAYFWVTENYGATWTQVDMNAFLVMDSGFTRGYCYSSLYAMNIYRSAPGTIWCIRSTPTVGGAQTERVFYSTDLGYTWAQNPDLAMGSNNNAQNYSLLNPFPDATDPSYIVIGSIGVDDRPDLYVSTDGWATKTAIANPSGYGGLSNLWRVNKRTFDNDHILAWFRHTAEAQMHLMESNDAGATWSLLYDSNLADVSIPNTGTGSSTGSVVNCARHNSPNGWPVGTEQQWVMIRAHVDSGSTMGVVQLTLDNFATAPVSKVGNLGTLLSPGGWVNGCANGYACPRVGPNA